VRGAPIEAIEMCGRNAAVTGLYEWVPGVPNQVNICPDCGNKLDDLIREKIDEVFREGGFE